MTETTPFAHWSLKTVPLVISVCTQCGHFVAATADNRLLAVMDRTHQCAPQPAAARATQQAKAPVVS